MTHITVNRGSDIEYSSNVLHLKGTEVRGGPSYTTVNIVIPKVNIKYYTYEDWRGEYNTSGTEFTFMTICNTKIIIKVNKEDKEKIESFLKDWKSQFISETANLLNLI
jgi:hypothetical protein